MIERNFSEISSHFSKQGNRMHAETLCDIHHKMKSANEFIAALKMTSTAYNIDFTEK